MITQPLYEDPNYVDFLREFSDADPEPPLDQTMPDKFTHRNRAGFAVGAGLHFPTEQVEKHIEWHKRLSAAYQKWLGQ